MKKELKRALNKPEFYRPIGEYTSFYSTCLRGFRLEEQAGRKLTFDEWFTGKLHKKSSE